MTQPPEGAPAATGDAVVMMPSKPAWENTKTKSKREKLRAVLPDRVPHLSKRTLFGAELKWSHGGRCCCRCIVYDDARLIVWILLLLVAIVTAGFFIGDMALHKWSVDQAMLYKYEGAVIAAGIFAFLTCILTGLQIASHKKHYIHPASQKHVIRILLMAPIYGISAFLSLIFLEWSLYLDLLRTCYEAFVIYSFLLLLTKYLAGHNGASEVLKTKGKLKWPAPFCCLKPTSANSQFLWGIKYGCLQYVVAAPAAAFTAMLTHELGVYGEGSFSFKTAYLYCAFVLNTSQLIALYCLVWFYNVTKVELKPFKPISKFILVKSVVFFTFWQSVALTLIGHLGLLGDDPETTQIMLQDLLICFEMFVAAVLHKYAFGHDAYIDGYLKQLMEKGAGVRQNNKTFAEADLIDPDLLKARLEQAAPGSFAAPTAYAAAASTYDDDDDNDVFGVTTRKYGVTSARVKFSASGIHDGDASDGSDDGEAVLGREVVRSDEFVAPAVLSEHISAPKRTTQVSIVKDLASKAPAHAGSGGGGSKRHDSSSESN